MTILEELAAYARERVAEAKKHIPEEEMKRLAEALPKGDFPFEKALRKPGISFICECKKASPSKGLIAPVFPYLDIAKQYEAAGADCISVLTEPKWFLGSDAYLREITEAVSVPCIRKDFTVNRYMIYEAKVLGASAVLLICSILSEEQIREYIGICDVLGLSALVEAHNAEEIHKAVRAGARIIGVNNRNLKDFSVDTGNSARLRELVPDDVVFVSESGVTGPKDIAKLRAAGVDAVLVGEALMRTEDKTAMLRSMREAAGPLIKLCGLSRPEDIETANALLPDYVGFVFYPKSKRHVSYPKAAELKKLLSPRIKAVGVFVNECPEVIATLINKGVIDAAQLHGDEDNAYIEHLRKLTDLTVIQAFRVRGPEDIRKAEQSAADLILLDAGMGTGTAFDWNLIGSIRRPYLLAGGLSPENVTQAVRTLRPYGVDVSSGIETGDVKDREKAVAFVATVREVTL
jgi:indole-3-glycerol phosphate synthase/phosphoribosylanthranilate isomerase